MPRKPKTKWRKWRKWELRAQAKDRKQIVTSANISARSGGWRRHRFVMSAPQQGSLALRYNAFMPPLQRFYDMKVWTEKKRLEKLNYMHQNPVKRRPLVKPAKLGRWPWSSWRFYHLGDASLLTMDPMP